MINGFANFANLFQVLQLLFVLSDLFWTCPNLLLLQNLLLFRVLLSWFPQAQGVSFLQPVFNVSNSSTFHLIHWMCPSQFRV